MTPPKKDVSIIIIIPGIYECVLFGERIFANVIKLRILICDHLGLSMWARNPKAGVLVRGEDVERRKGHVKMEQSWEGVAPSHGRLTVLRSWKKQERESLLELQKGAGPCGPWTPGLQNEEAINFCYFKPPNLCNPSKLSTGELMKQSEGRAG